MAATRTVPALDTIHHVGFIVKDFDRMVEFYTTLIGREVDTEASLRGKHIRQQFQKQTGLEAEVDVAFIQLASDGAIEMIRYVEPGAERDPKPTPANRPGINHFCFQVDDVEAVYARLREAGYDTHGDPVHFGEDAGPLEGYVFGYFDDPEGNVLEVIQEP